MSRVGKKKHEIVEEISVMTTTSSNDDKPDIQIIFFAFSHSLYCRRCYLFVFPSDSFVAISYSKLLLLLSVRYNEKGESKSLGNGGGGVVDELLVRIKQKSTFL